MSELAEWDSFYVIVGSAAGALIGLQFVVMALIAERPQIPSPEAGGIRDPDDRPFQRGAAPVRSSAGSMGDGRHRCRALESHWLRWNGVWRHRRPAHADAEDISTGPRGLVVPCPGAVGGVYASLRVGIRDPLPCPRGSVRRWLRGAGPPPNRHSQRLGHRRLPRTCQEGQERLSGVKHMRMD